MAAPRKYSVELKERATRMAVEARQDPATRAGALKRIADQLGVHPEALRTWVKQAEVDDGVRPGTTTSDAERIAQLERENRELRRANTILKQASAFFGGGDRPPTALIVEFVAAHRDEHGVDPICAALRETAAQIAPSTVRAHLSPQRTESARAVRDRQVLSEIRKVHADNLGVYGARKVHASLKRKGMTVARCTVERLMKSDGLHGIPRLKGRKTTHSDGAETPRPADRVQRRFVADAPNVLWVADLTYIRTHSGWVYAAFVLDVFSRMIVGWQVSTSMRTDLALDALDMGLWARRRVDQDVAGLIHHSDRGVQYRAVRYTERLDECDAVSSVGSKGDSYDNAMAEAFNSLFKAECIRNPVMRPHGGWRSIGEVEWAVAEYIDWFNHRRLHGEINHVPPVEYEAAYWANHSAADYRETPVLAEA
ncbi:IS3 family transposase, partial [Rhodococcus yananensis]|uniref:IS3 family transposase n=1 Tax=Rhodococcus yananensis TaxID=2879464 RepID=UPI001CF7ED21